MANKKIFMADDDEGIVDAVKMILEVMDFDVKYTLDGSTVIDDLQNKPDLILLDIWMSGYDGRDICRQLKSDDNLKDIPVLMISASRDIGQSALDAGADAFMEKPFEMDALLNKIGNLLN